MKNDVIQICGPYPDGFTKAVISSDANYVFINDPDFLPLKFGTSIATLFLLTHLRNVNTMFREVGIIFQNKILSIYYKIKLAC